MKRETKAIGTDLTNLVEDTHALLTSTVDVASNNVKAATKSLSDNLTSGKEMAFGGISAADDAIRKYPYYAIGICVLGSLSLGLGLGILIAQGIHSTLSPKSP